MAEKAESLEKDIISFAIRIALIFKKESGAKARLRQVLWDIVKGSIRRHVGGHSGLAEQSHRELILNTFVNTKRPRGARLKSLMSGFSMATTLQTRLIIIATGVAEVFARH